MSYISKRGDEAAKSAQQESTDYSKLLTSLKSGDTIKVRLLTSKDFVEYFAASVYKVFYTTPVTPGNLYQKACDVLYKEAKEVRDSDEKLSKELSDKAYSLKPKARYLFAFIDLGSGEPIIVDLTKNQAQSVITSITKYEKRIGKLAFELSKTGSGTSTAVTLSPVIDMEEDLTDKERENFNKPKVDEIADELFENALVLKSHDEQVADLVAFGFDVSKLGIEGDDVKPIESDGGVEIQDDDLPF